MYTGAFNVVDKNSQTPSTINLNSVPTANASAGGCGSGSSGGGCGCGGGGAQVKKDATDTVAKVQGDAQIINAAYTASDYLRPNSFKVKAGQNLSIK